jgi:PAS domain S-box-containing protein
MNGLKFNVLVNCVNRNDQLSLDHLIRKYFPAAEILDPDSAESAGMPVSVIPDLLISDMDHVRGMQSAGFRNKMKDHPLPVLIIDNNKLADYEKLSFLRSGDTGFISKPFDRFEVIDKIHTFASLGHARRAMWTMQQQAINTPAINSEIREKYHVLGQNILKILSYGYDRHESLRRVLDEIRRVTEVDAVAIRLQKNDDFPYYCYDGFPDDFVKSENNLVRRNNLGGLCRDDKGHVDLECTCGLVIMGRTLKGEGAFSPGGSAWTNDSAPFLEIPREEDLRLNPRNRCIHQGYSSIALVPVRAKGSNVGLLQLNDKRKERFSPEIIEMLEAIAENIGEALLRKQAELDLKESEELLRKSQELGKLGSWEMNYDDDRMIWSEGLYQLLGLKKGMCIPGYNEYIKRIHPVDRLAVETAYKSSLQQGLDSYEIEYRLKPLAHANSVEVYEKCEHIKDASGNVIRSIAILQDITQRKEAGYRLQKSEEKFRILSENSIVGMCIIRDMKLVYTNPALMNMLGYEDAEQLCGMDLKLLICKDDFPFLMKGINDGLEGMVQENSRICRAITKNGKIIYIEIYGNPIDYQGGPAIMATMIDITDRKMAEDALKQNINRLELAMEVANMAWWEMDVETGNLDFEPRKATMLGYKPSELRIYNDFAGLIHPNDKAKALKALQDHVEGRKPVYEVEYRIRQKNGEYKWVYDVGSLFASSEKNHARRVTGLVYDISLQKGAEKEIRELNDTLEQRVQQRTAQLEALNSEQEAFSYSVSHDLRAPLRSIHGFTQILIEDYANGLDDEGKRICTVIKDNSIRMGRLIDELLEFSRLGRADMVQSKTDMTSLIRSVFAEIAPPPHAQKLQLVMKDLPDVPADEAMLRQVWTNLISNALKYTSKSEEPRIEISAVVKEDHVIYSIRDNGVGFDMNYVDKLFGVFQRLHSSKEFDGTGVGLAIVKRIVNRHGGEVRAESGPEGGACFSFSLPLNPTSPAT